MSCFDGHAKNAGQDEIASFFAACDGRGLRPRHQLHELLEQLGGTDNTSPQS